MMVKAVLGWGVRVRLLVTAFGPFGGRSCNASSMALAGLGSRFPWINTRVLPVDCIEAPLRMNRALREVEPDAVILLGEASGSEGIRLETTGWNELDFRIPDNAGMQPLKQKIVGEAPDALASTLPLERIYGRLEEAGYPMEMSDDPGRYLCNQILFHTLWRIERFGLGARAGFVHLPLEDVCSTETAIGALELVIEETLRTGSSAEPWAGRRVARTGVRGRLR